MNKLSSVFLTTLVSLTVATLPCYAASTSPEVQICLKKLFEQLGNPSSRDVTLVGPSQIATVTPHDKTANRAYVNLDTNGQGTIAYSCHATKMPYSCNYLSSAQVTSCQADQGHIMLELSGDQATATLNLQLEHSTINTAQVNIRSTVAGVSPSEEENSQFVRQ